MLTKDFKYVVLEIKPLSSLVDFKNHRRLGVFFQKGVKCACCDFVATQIVLGKEKRGNGLHWDLYDDDFNALTIDHITPKSKGGKDIMENLQPMCFKCNVEKGNNVNI